MTFKEVTGITLDQTKFKEVNNVVLDVPTEPVPDTFKAQRKILGLDEGAVTADDIGIVGENTPWLNVLAEGMDNVPSSAKQFAKDTFNTVFHLWETVKGVTGLAVGAAQKLHPGEQEQEKNVDLLVDFMKDRYGSVEGLKQTIANDPVGMLADAVSFMVPGGAALKTAGAATKLNVLRTVGGTISKTGALLDPLNVIKAGAKLPFKLIPKNKTTNMYKRAVKFSSRIPEDELNLIVNTAIDNQILPTYDGLHKIAAKTNVLNKEITDMIQVAASRGEQIQISDFLKHLDKLKTRTALNYDKKIDKVVASFIDQNAVKKNTSTMSPKEAQRVKLELYDELNKAYATMAAKPIPTETKMLIARNIKESLELIIPEIKQLNANESALLSLRDNIEGRVATLSKGNLINYDRMARSAVGGVFGGPLGASAGLSLGVLSAPTVQAKIALVLDSIRNKGIKITPTRTAIGLGLITPERIKENE
jgi:hypothetical protein